MQQLVQTGDRHAASRPYSTNQFGIGLYPFARWMQSYQALSTNLTTIVNIRRRGPDLR